MIHLWKHFFVFIKAIISWDPIVNSLPDFVHCIFINLGVVTSKLTLNELWLQRPRSGLWSQTIINYWKRITFLRKLYIFRAIHFETKHACVGALPTLATWYVHYTSAAPESSASARSSLGRIGNYNHYYLFVLCILAGLSPLIRLCQKWQCYNATLIDSVLQCYIFWRM
jgi:hypothetical protein